MIDASLEISSYLNSKCEAWLSWKPKYNDFLFSSWLSTFLLCTNMIFHCWKILNFESSPPVSGSLLSNWAYLYVKKDHVHFYIFESYNVSGAYLISCGIRGAMLFMSWLGIKVLPVIKNSADGDESPKVTIKVDSTLNMIKEKLNLFLFSSYCSYRTDRRRSARV